MLEACDACLKSENRSEKELVIMALVLWILGKKIFWNDETQ